MNTNHEAVLKERAERRLDVLDQIGELQEELKQMKAEDKADGFNEKALGQVIKELRRGAEYQADQLTLELEIDTYRRACGLPQTLEAAQKCVREEVTGTSFFGEGDTVRIGDGPEIPAREFERAVKSKRRRKAS